MEGTNNKNNNLQSEIVKKLKEKIAENLQKEYSESKKGNNANGEGEENAVDLDNNKELRNRIAGSVKDHVMARLSQENKEKAQRLNFIKNQINDHLKIEESNKIESQEDREAEVQRMKEEAQKDIEKQLSKSMKGWKAKIASRAMGEAATRIALKLAEEAEQGGAMAYFVFIFTLIIAIVVDVIDLKGFALEAALSATIVGTIVFWVIKFAIPTSLSLIISTMWMMLLGGGHAKWFWKRVIPRIIIMLFVVENVEVLDLIPWTTICVLWNWVDLYLEKRKAQKQLDKFVMTQNRSSSSAFAV